LGVEAEPEPDVDVDEDEDAMRTDDWVAFLISSTGVNTTATRPPDIMPAPVKQSSVDEFGYVPGLLTC